MNIETLRLRIRDFITEDAVDLQEILGDAETMAHCEPPYDMEKTKQFLHDFCIEKKGAMAAVQKESGKVIGYILFNSFGEGEYEIGWIFNRAYWRRGYAYEACSAVIGYAFGQLKARRIFAETVDLEKSVPLMCKLGMHKAGVEQICVENKQMEMHLYGLAENEWRQHGDCV